MSFTQFTQNADIIQSLPTSPKESDGYSASVLKAYFDDIGNYIKTYINDTLLTELEAIGGAGKIGATAFESIVTETIQLQLEELYNLIIPTTGNVTGPASATDGDFVQFNLTTGKLIKGGIKLDTAITGAGLDTEIPSSKAVVDYVSAGGGGDFSGPSGAVDGNLVSFNGVGGKIGEDSGVKATDVMQNLSDDATPQLGGELDTDGNSIVHTLYDNSDAGATITIDWSANGQIQKVNMDQASTFTFTNPTKSTTLMLYITYDGNYDVTWDGDVIWAGNSAPTLTKTAGRTDLITFAWNGSKYFAAANLNYTA